MDRFWDPPLLEPERVRLYGPDTFCLVLAQKLGLHLVSPADDLLLNAPVDLLRRDLRLHPLEALSAQAFPLFAKSLVPKLFRSRAYPTWADLEDECRGLDPATPVLLSSVVEILAEARAFVLQGQVVTCSVYEGSAEPPEAFLSQAARLLDLPQTCVLDAALLPEGWALLEANATWGAGLNGCSPAAVVPCLELATRPSE
ncbi:MAG: ATP-grasp domain-containing protein [Candidatus Eremiobacteraeota bacterium]|nr:ATP-grasp domain-containing protein [Candidatus Eremiobacteraeota bacterium]